LIVWVIFKNNILFL